LRRRYPSSAKPDVIGLSSNICPALSKVEFLPINVIVVAQPALALVTISAVTNHKDVWTSRDVTLQ
jgi:hypothetical protein